ncbi:restriction endonuclease subunit M [Levilactobacillus brevis]|uniref:BREX-1 system adenine-specific DNA-methyltransferase PglX n=1 Tax=Levilactobacillus brevis TaxID=1580 RepID=UPI0007605D67|nr:BREX-1 system adenine-specific DNA-methyltransferase PglX [Levilactobacillus brevis]KWT46401.1 restriction endonuclease subunit M [Levilactobacillus brevis]MBT1150897.1 BREX-1 system adenine-specific DNA-methyltransferase PglX [Lactiplantibacillus argentoratensis]
MDKKKIHDFAVSARRNLISSIKLRLAQVGITEKGATDKLPNSTAEIEFYVANEQQGAGQGISGRDIARRTALVNRLTQAAEKGDWVTAYKNLVEEAAYTWFNRIIAIRFMEVNHYLPSRVAVLSSEEGHAEPDILVHALEIEDDLGSFTDEQRQLIEKAQDTQDPKTMDKAYRMLFLKQANALNANLPLLFEKTSDTFQLLFTPSYQNGVIKELVTEVPRDDFDVEKEGQVEIIGWLYQYYNEEPKDLAFKKSKYTLVDIPAVTQLFTPDWIVKYLVENSLGRYWIDILHACGDQRSEKEIAEDFGWRYFMPAAEQDPSVSEKLHDIRQSLKGRKISDITFLDPAMGSGHILIYAFDVLMQFYLSEGYARREAARSIVTNNLYGLDIDHRAFQLAYFAILMKARQYDRRALNGDLTPHVFDVPQTNFSEADLAELANALPALSDPEHIKALKSELKEFNHGKVLGSLVRPTMNSDAVANLQNVINAPQQTLLLAGHDLVKLLRVHNILATEYDIVATNPPYMGSGKMAPDLGKFIKKEYPASKGDLFAVFMELARHLSRSNAYYALITQHQWMFLSSFEKLRGKLQSQALINMAHLGTHAFEEIGGEVVQSTAFVMQNHGLKNYVGTYERLVDEPSQDKKETKYLDMVERPDQKQVYRTNQANFKKISGSPIAYWFSKNAVNLFELPLLGSLMSAGTGLQTSDGKRFIRFWYEVNNKRIGRIKHWVHYDKGGGYRRWYGNQDYVVNWEDDGKEIKQYISERYPYLHGNYGFVVKNEKNYFKPGLVTSKVTSGILGFRIVTDQEIYSDATTGVFPENNFSYYLALTNSPILSMISDLNPTINFQASDLEKLPIKLSDNRMIDHLSDVNVFLAKIDWDNFEKSEKFSVQFLLIHIAEHNRNWTVEAAFNQWKQEAQDRFDQLKKNEEELNRIFIGLYGLQDELSPEESDKEVSVRRADLGRDIRAFMSYFIGVTFGRYSLDTPGLAFAGGDWDASKYTTYQPNKDDVIILTDDDYFGDERDIMYRFKEFLTTTFGKEHLEENLTFIANALGKAGDSAEEQIRNYLFNDFYKNHTTIYQKRPIYWELNSGRQGGFRALMYLHRYDPDTMAMIRTSYLHDLQAAYEKRIANLSTFIDTETNTKQKNKMIKQRDHVRKQLDELVKYDVQLQHVANMHIALDLDDGVVVNHKKVQADAKLLAPIK